MKNRRNNIIRKAIRKAIGISIMAFILLIVMADSSTQFVNINNSAFQQEFNIVPIGTNVTWTNLDSITHTVTEDTGKFDSGNLNKTESFEFMFNSLGTFNYHCKIHPFMIGSVAIRIKGDIDGNGQITVADALLYLRYSVGQNISPFQISTSDDVTCDQVITVADALKVLRKAVGQNVTLGC